MNQQSDENCRDILWWNAIKLLQGQKGMKLRNEPFLDERWSTKNIGEKRGSKKALILVSA
jgi:hypothetical protein